MTEAARGRQREVRFLSTALVFDRLPGDLSNNVTFLLGPCGRVEKKGGKYD